MLCWGWLRTGSLHMYTCTPDVHATRPKMTDDAMFLKHEFIPAARTKCHKDERYNTQKYGKAAKPMAIHNSTFRLKSKNISKFSQKTKQSKMLTQWTHDAIPTPPTRQNHVGETQSEREREREWERERFFDFVETRMPAHCSSNLYDGCNLGTGLI